MGMSLAHHADEFVVEEFLLVETKAIHGMAVHGQIQRTAFQRRFHFIHGQAGCGQAHIWGRILQLGQQPRQQNGLSIVVQVEMKRAIRGSRNIFSLPPQRFVQKLQCFPDRRRQFPGQTSWAHSCPVPHKERVIEERAQSRQRAADGWLAPSQSSSRAADVTLGKNSIKHDQKIQVECGETGGPGRQRIQHTGTGLWKVIPLANKRHPQKRLWIWAAARYKRPYEDQVLGPRLDASPDFRGRESCSNRTREYTEAMKPHHANISVVRRLYEARGNPEVIRQVLAPDVRWEVVEGFPYSEVYLGLDAVLERFCKRLFADFEEWHTEPSEFFAADDRVFALGTYSARATTTGRSCIARFAHVWTVRDGVLVRLQQCADTAQLAKALDKDPVKEGV